MNNIMNDTTQTRPDNTSSFSIILETENLVINDSAGPHAFAMMLSWVFPPYSNKKMIYGTTGYAVNNVAFRRQFLLEYTISCDLDINRGICTIHGGSLRKLGSEIWKQPKTRVIHPCPKVSQ